MSALGHMCAQLREARAQEIPAISSLVTELAAVRQEIDAAADGPAVLGAGPFGQGS